MMMLLVLLILLKDNQMPLSDITEYVLQIDQFRDEICSESLTIDPTSQPTDSPIYAHCDIGYSLDVILLLDASCGLCDNEWDVQREGVAEYLSAIKDGSSPRFGLITFIIIWKIQVHLMKPSNLIYTNVS
eukprot:410146_1